MPQQSTITLIIEGWGKTPSEIQQHLSTEVDEITSMFEIDLTSEVSAQFIAGTDDLLLCISINKPEAVLREHWSFISDEIESMLEIDASSVIEITGVSFR